MRNLLLAAVATALMIPSTAGATATATQPPGTCDLIKNTICHLIPPTSVEDVCEIIETTTVFGCEITTTSRS